MAGRSGSPWARPLPGSARQSPRIWPDFPPRPQGRTSPGGSAGLSPYEALKRPWLGGPVQMTKERRVHLAGGRQAPDDVRVVAAEFGKEWMRGVNEPLVVLIERGPSLAVIGAHCARHAPA